MKRNIIRKVARALFLYTFVVDTAGGGMPCSAGSCFKHCLHAVVWICCPSRLRPPNWIWSSICAALGLLSRGSLPLGQWLTFCSMCNRHSGARASPLANETVTVSLSDDCLMANHVKQTRNKNSWFSKTWTFTCKDTANSEILLQKCRCDSTNSQFNTWHTEIKFHTVLWEVPIGLFIFLCVFNTNLWGFHQLDLAWNTNNLIKWKNYTVTAGII